MLYRWGFIENDVFSECNPIVDDDAALEFSQEAGQIFFRAKLNGDLAFRFEFDAILAKGYNYTHIVVLQWYDNTDNTWKECWRGHFSLTDCEIDYDSNTISVQPATMDRYTKILEELETEYNLTKLNAPIQQVSINIRPCLQIYGFADNKITNYIGNNYWEGECDVITDVNELTDTFKFTRISGKAFIQMINLEALPYTENGVSYNLPANTTIIIGGNAGLVGEDVAEYPMDWTATAYDSARQRNVEFSIHILQYPRQDRYAVYWPGVASEEFNAFYDEDNKLRFTWSGAHKLEGEYGVVNVIYARTLLNIDEGTTSVVIGGHTMDVYDFPTDDLTGSNMNYNKVMQTTTALVKSIESDTTQDDPTIWGVNYNDKYFVKPVEGSYHIMPVAQSMWWFTSLWWYPYYAYSDNIDSFAAKRTIKDGYQLSLTTLKLLQKADWHGTYWISGILGGSQDYAGYRFMPVITPKSNVISSYYNTPAQNAPISLAKIFSMLKTAYRIYWYIDANNNIHLEHISYFDNGYKYTEDEPDILIDLDTKIHTRTYESKVFGQNKIKFEKSNMPQQMAFAWMDKQTMVFDGWPIKCLDLYVQQGQKEENNVGDFSTDIDCILGSPGDFSKDGFVLFALPPSGGYYLHTLPIVSLPITDESGESYNVRIQNSLAAFAKIHENMWRYDLPCENVNINNKETTAITTGRFKLQSIEFADEIMAEILKDISNCLKPIRTQQGDGHIKSISINLNSLAAKADLLFNFIGRWYYLRGTALGNSITIFVNGESTTIEVSANKFKYRYNTPITALTFNGADVVSVNLTDCDNLDGLTSAANMFENCSELIAVDFGNKKLGAVTDATDMFAGCAQLSTLICPATSTWKPDLNFEDCPLLTTESIYSLIEYLFVYESGTHTLTFNQTMWDAIDPDVQTDIIAKANAKGWNIAISTAYFVSGTSTSDSEIFNISFIDDNQQITQETITCPVSGGTFKLKYKNKKIYSLDNFVNSNSLTSIDFSESDGLAGLTSLNDAFKNCSSLTSVNFTNCDISNVVSASDCFANCAALTNLTIPAGTWKADVDFSTCPLIVYAEMLDIIGGLFTYTSGTHTITWNSTYWDTLTQVQQQTISDAADAKGWTTNAVMVMYHIRGKSTILNGYETLGGVKFLNDGETIPYDADISAATDADGNYEYSYSGKHLYSLQSMLYNNITMKEIEFTEDMSELVAVIHPNTNRGAFERCALTSLRFPKAEFSKLQGVSNLYMNWTYYAMDIAEFVVRMDVDIFPVLQNAQALAANFKVTNLNLAKCKFASVDNANSAFYGLTNCTTIDLSDATFENATDTRRIFQNCTALTTLILTKQNTAILPTSLPSNAPIDLHWSPLNYQSMLNVANWLSDLTGYSAHTCTFKTSAWNALTSAEQATIQGILQSKNWNLATA